MERDEEKGMKISLKDIVNIGYGGVVEEVPVV